MKMLRLLLAAALILAPFEQALAGAGTITTKDAAGATRTFVIVTDGTGNFVAPTVICDATAAATCAAVGAAGVKVDGSGATQPVSGTVTANIGTVGTLATAALQTTGNTTLTTINTTLGSPFQAGASIGNTTFAATQATSSNLKAQVDPLTAASWGIGTSTQNSTSVANGHLVLGQFNTAPTTISSGNMSALQMDNAGNLLVNIKAGAGSGGTALADGATFTEATTNFTPIGGEYVSGGGANCTTGKGCTLQMTIDRMAYVNLGKVNGTAIGTPATYGSTPTGTALSVNAFVTNSNANGQATMANSSPVTLASNQSTINVATQAIATGGSSTTGNIAANNTTAVVVKASAGTLYGAQVYGIGSAPAYLKIYNAASATCGSGTPVKRIMIPAAPTAANGAGSNVSFGVAGTAFGTGITYCITTGITDADTTAPAASTFLINLDWSFLLDPANDDRPMFLSAVG